MARHSVAVTCVPIILQPTRSTTITITRRRSAILIQKTLQQSSSLSMSLSSSSSLSTKRLLLRRRNGTTTLTNSDGGGGGIWESLHHFTSSSNSPDNSNSNTDHCCSTRRTALGRFFSSSSSSSFNNNDNNNVDHIGSFDKAKNTADENDNSTNNDSDNTNTSDNDNSSSVNNSIVTIDHRSGPMIIGRTARSQRSRNKVNTTTTMTTSTTNNTVGGGPHMKSRPNSTTGNGTIPTTSTHNNNKSSTSTDSLISHIINGGTPDDPTPPPFHLANFGENSLYTLVLLRHGESEWNKLNQYTGWCDVELTKKGELEAREAGRLLYDNGIELDHAFTSVLKRASFSCNMALNMAHQHWVPVTKSWRLNERHYGAYVSGVFCVFVLFYCICLVRWLLLLLCHILMIKDMESNAVK
jgi:hypothetical protein